jgi:hypothetical protein
MCPCAGDTSSFENTRLMHLQSSEYVSAYLLVYAALSY